MDQERDRVTFIPGNVPVFLKYSTLPELHVHSFIAFSREIDSRIPRSPPEIRNISLNFIAAPSKMSIRETQSSRAREKRFPPISRCCQTGRRRRNRIEHNGSRETREFPREISENYIQKRIEIDSACIEIDRTLAAGCGSNFNNAISERWLSRNRDRRNDFPRGGGSVAAGGVG